MFVIEFGYNLSFFKTIIIISKQMTVCYGSHSVTLGPKTKKQKINNLSIIVTIFYFYF